MIKLNTPLEELKLKKLKAGDRVLISGVIYTMRDAAHKKLIQQLSQNKKIPLSLPDTVVYYCGPTPVPPGKNSGACGPTTSSRMDGYTPLLLKHGLRAMIGKGQRSELVVDSIKKHKAVYFVTLGGGGAFLSNHVKKSVLVAYPELGTEAIRQFTVQDFPLIVAIDSKGNDLFTKIRK